MLQQLILVEVDTLAEVGILTTALVNEEVRPSRQQKRYIQR